MRNVARLVQFFKELNLDEVRVIRPAPFIFFCGGQTDNPGAPDFKSLRDYVLRKPLNFKFRVVKAEDAVDLFKRARYGDLIEFEAHIAQISDLVLLICESAGSLAELGAFSQVPDIAKRLYVLVQDKHYQNDSFVKLGPLRALSEKYSEAVGAFPWDIDGQGNLSDPNGFSENDDDIIAAVNSRLRQESEKLNLENEGHLIVVVYWICFMLRSATLAEIYEFFKQIGNPIPQAKIRNFLFSMQVAGWIQEVNLGAGYYIPHFDRDPFEYAYVVKDVANSTKAQKVKIDIGSITKEDKLRPKRIVDLVGAGEPEPTLENMPEVDGNG